MEVLGKEYIIDFCISYWKNKIRKEASIFYVCDTLKMIAHNTSQGHGGYSPSKELREILYPDTKDDVINSENKAKEIKNNIKEKLRKIQYGQSLNPQSDADA